MIHNTVRFLLIALLFSDCTNVIEFIPRHKFPHLSKKYSSEGVTKQELEANLKTDTNIVIPSKINNIMGERKTD